MKKCFGDEFQSIESVCLPDNVCISDAGSERINGEWMYLSKDKSYLVISHKDWDKDEVYLKYFRINSDGVENKPTKTEKITSGDYSERITSVPAGKAFKIFLKTHG